MMVKDKILFDLIRDYFTFYLPKVRKSSKHTLRSYRTAINSFLDFVKDKHGIELSKITLSMLDANALTAYLESLEQSGKAISTRHLRLTCIKAFFSYVADVEPTAVSQAEEISKVTTPKIATQRLVAYLTEPAVKALLEQPDPLTKKGMRDRLFLLLIYDTGARLQEMRRLKLCDITWGKTVNLTLLGKGDKLRTVPLMAPTALHLKNYVNVFHPDSDNYSKIPLFYTEQHGQKNAFSDSVARKLVREYGDAAKAVCPEFPDIVHPHLLRHSRAMHLYQHGMDLTLIQQWLGHAQLQTTHVYAYADTEHKRKAIEKSTAMNNPLRKKRSVERFIVTNEEKLRQLYGLT